MEEVLKGSIAQLQCFICIDLLLIEQIPLPMFEDFKVPAISIIELIFPHITYIQSLSIVTKLLIITNLQIFKAAAKNLSLKHY